MAIAENNGPDQGDAEGFPLPASLEQPPSSAEDEAIGLAKRQAAAARIRQIAEDGRLRNAQRLADHLANHGEVTVTSVEEFLRETEGLDEVATDED